MSKKERKVNICNNLALTITTFLWRGWGCSCKDYVLGRSNHIYIKNNLHVSVRISIYLVYNINHLAIILLYHQESDLHEICKKTERSVSTVITINYKRVTLCNVAFVSIVHN